MQQIQVVLIRNTSTVWQQIHTVIPPNCRLCLFFETVSLELIFDTFRLFSQLLQIASLPVELLCRRDACDRFIHITNGYINLPQIQPFVTQARDKVLEYLQHSLRILGMFFYLAFLGLTMSKYICLLIVQYYPTLILFFLHGIHLCL